MKQPMAPIDSLRPNPWNTNVVSPDNEKRIEKSILDLGVFKPITVRTLPDGSLEILGGQHRWEAHKRLGHKQVAIFNVGTVSDDKAKKIGLADNARYGEDDTVGLARLLKELGTPQELSQILPYDEADFVSIFSAESIDLETLGLPDDQNDPDLKADRPSPTHQIMRFKVPVADVARLTADVEDTMKRHNFTADDSLTNAGNALIALIYQDRKVA